jgi:putative ABC transport system substrate-binding protein
MLVGRTNRRAFIAGLGGAAAWPLMAPAQQPSRTYSLGFLLPYGRDNPGFTSFFDELRLNGYVEGQNLTIVADGFDVHDQLPAHAAAVVKTAPDMIFSGPDPYSRVVQEATSTIPIGRKWGTAGDAYCLNDGLQRVSPRFIRAQMTN